MSALTAPGWSLPCEHNPVRRTCPHRCGPPNPPVAPKKTDKCPICRNNLTYAHCKHFAEVWAKYAEADAVYQNMWGEPSEAAKVDRILADYELREKDPAYKVRREAEEAAHEAERVEVLGQRVHPSEAAREYSAKLDQLKRARYQERESVFTNAVAFTRALFNLGWLPADETEIRQQLLDTHGEQGKRKAEKIIDARWPVAASAFEDETPEPVKPAASAESRDARTKTPVERPSAGLTAEEQAYFDKRMGTTAERLAFFRLLPTSAQVPSELTALPRWVCSRKVPDEKNPAKSRKPPYSPKNGKGIGATEEYADEFTDFATARAAAVRLKMDGVGFVFREGDGYVGIDFDNAIGADGAVDSEVQNWLRWFGHSWTEISISGNGFHVIGRGTISKALRATPLSKTSAATVEVYGWARFFRVSGKVTGDVLRVENIQPSLDKLLTHLGGGDSRASGSLAREKYGPMTISVIRSKYATMLAAFRAMTHPNDSQNDQLNACAYFLHRALLAGALDKSETQLLDELRSIAHSTKHCAGIVATLNSGWGSGEADGPFQVLDPEKEHADALAWVDGTWLADETFNPLYEEALAKLALLTEEEYEMGGRRDRAAKRLGMKKPTKLDEFVKQRRQHETHQPSDELIEFKTCEPWPEPVNGGELLSEVAVTFRRFIVFKHEHDAEVMALWALGSHLYEEFSIFPRLGFTSPLPECGKTTALDVLEHLALRATRSDNLTTAVAFRIMEFHPSLLLDELDTFLHDNPELIGVLNSGHKKGGYVFRMEKVNERMVMTRFATYGPVAYGMIGHPTGTLFSRTLFVRLERKSADQQAEDFDPDENPALAEELSTLRRKLARWVADHRAEVKECRPNTASLANRARNNWRPLLKIAQVAGGSWTTQTLEAAGVSAPRGKKTDQERLLRDIRNIFHTRQVDRLPSTLLLADLLTNHDTIWYRYHKKRDPLDVNDLADLLSDFDIGPTAMFASKELQLKLFNSAKEKKVTWKGYLLADFLPLFQKYLNGLPEEVAVANHGPGF